MATYLSGGICSSICSHPSCWNNSRKIHKNQQNIPENFDNKNRLSIDIPRQSILNINLDSFLLNKQNSNPSLQSNRNNDIIEYLISRKKMTTASATNVSPQIDYKLLLKESTNTKTTPSLPKLDVHELFDIHELNSDWRNTFKPKDVYVWIPRHHNETSVKKEKEFSKTARLIKTPALQLAPVIQSENNSARKQTWSASAASEINNSHISKIYSKKIQKRKAEKQRLKSSNRLDEYYKNPQNIEHNKESIRKNSLEATLCPSKMPIYSINDRNLKRFDSVLSNQIYVMDTTKINESLNFESFQHKSPQRCIGSTEISPSYLECVNMVKTQGLNAKTVSLIYDSFSKNDHDFLLGPQRFANTLNKISSRSQSSGFPELNEKNSICDSMMTNALSNRSTLNDEDIFPGTTILQHIQNFNMKEKCPSIGSDISQKINLNDMNEPLDEVVQMHEQPASATRSLVENNSQIIELPNPPPPSPEISIRIKLTSSVTDITRISQENVSSDI